MDWNSFRTGVRRGIPVGVGYFSVSFGFGAMAAAQGIRALDATLISATNLTSAGQFAGLTLIVASASLWELILTQIVINSRYALMSLALGQRMGERFGFWQRMLLAFFNTDEIFAVAMAHAGSLKFMYMVGLQILPILGWTAGTAIGAAAGSVLPAALTSALGVALYGMFIAVVVPAARRVRPVLATALLAVGFSCILYILNVSAGVSIILCTVAASAVMAFIRPLEGGMEE